jgi:hypothetical protein
MSEAEQERMELLETLLRDALHILNQIPNTIIRSDKYRSTYDFAASINDTLKR